MKTFIFGYGSLLDPQGLNGRGMKRKYVTADLIPASLRRYQRDWNADAPTWGYRYLGVVPKVGASTNGVLFELADEDMKAFKYSEGGSECYSYDDVTYNIECSGLTLDPGVVRVLTCVTKKPSFDLPVPKYYLKIVDRCLEHRGEEFKRIFWASTPFPTGVEK